MERIKQERRRMAGPENEIVINGFPWKRLSEADTQANWGYSEELVRRCGGDPREVERLTGVEIADGKATARNTN
jgi:hypothetical protein